MKKVCLSATMMFVLLWMTPQSHAAATTQVDALIKKLVEKGILTDDEADQLKDEIKYDEKTIRETNMKTDLPQWVQDTKLKGDFRLRHEFLHRNDSTDADRNRGRLRYRLGIESKVNDKVIVAVGIASNGGNGTTNANPSATATDFSPRSNNDSFQNTFSKRAPVLNYAYAQYMPNDKMIFTGGKMMNPLWEPWEFLWDNDITPEGAAAQFTYPLNDKVSLFTTLAGFQISEISSNEADPFMYVVQGGLKGKVTEKFDYKIGGSWYGTDNITKTLLANRAGTNTINPRDSSQYAYHYNTAVGAAEFGVNDPLGDNPFLYIPRIAVFGEYADNPDAPEMNKAWMGGAYMGNIKVGGWGTWKATMAYKFIGRDAFLDTFPDSDFYSGSTDIKGYEGLLEVGLAKNFSLAFDYYRGERIKTTKAPESVLQTDINFKF